MHDHGVTDGLEQVWSFEAVLADGSGVLVRWTLPPDSPRCWFWAYLTRPDGTAIAVRDHDAPLPRGRTLEIRSDGLWAEGVCEVAFEHWSLGLEAFAVLLDPATDGWHGERGERVPFGYELDWESSGEAEGTAHHEVQPGRLHGEILLGDGSSTLDAVCIRVHRASPPEGARSELRVTDGATVDLYDEPEAETDDAGVPRSAAIDGGFAVSSWAAVPVDGSEHRIALAAGTVVGGAGGAADRLGWLEVRR
jgi:hypothetical protein